MKRLSYSGYNTYVTCPKKYDYNYNERIVSDTTPSHLVFGSAVDKALNEILLGKTIEEAQTAAQLELNRLFTDKVSLIDSDFDGDLITPSTREMLIERLKKIGWEGNDPAMLARSLFDKVAMGGTLNENQIKSLNLLVYMSFLEKNQLICESFVDYVVPQLEEVVNVQRYVDRGILDFEAKFKGVEGVVVCDNKTSARDYEQDAVRVSVQLAGYGAVKGAYIVFNKTVRKNRTKTCSECGNNGTGKRHKTCDAVIEGVRCNAEWDETISPEIVPQIIIDDIPEHNRTMVEQAYQDVEKLIETKVFPRNLTNCSKQFGRPCEYFNLCWKNDPKGLVKKK